MYMTKKKPVEVRQIDYDDIKLRTCNERSFIGKIAAYQQNILEKETKEIQTFLKEQFKGMKEVRALSKREIKEQQDREIDEAISQIRQKYFSSALQKKKPNKEFQKALDHAGFKQKDQKSRSPDLAHATTMKR